MINIENLEVQFEVSGDSDEEIFARYFARFIDEWSREQQVEQELQARLHQDQMLGD